MMSFTRSFYKYTLICLLVLVCLIGLRLRIDNFYKLGGDFWVYENAVESLKSGTNFYDYTVSSFEEEGKDHGYAYLPGLAYIYLFFEQILGTRLSLIFKLPLLIADISIVVLLIYTLRKNLLYTLFAITFWVLNPHLLMKGEYVSTDFITIAFTLYAIHFLESQTKISAFSYVWGLLTKTFSILMLPMFIIKSKNKLLFVLITGLTLLLASIPFLDKPLTYIQGAFFVHSDRSFQGNPLLFLISFYMNIEIIRVIPIALYSFLSIFGAWVITTILLIQKRSPFLKDKYVLSSLAFFNFYFFTPVLNRTYLLWWLPFLFLVGQNIMDTKYKYYWYGFLILLYVSYLFIYQFWGGGLHIKYAGY